ncbi:hypothetical protein [Seonamhaeicola marinus]|uniref:OmpH family outer membrane protein n=1 Tax=Seonamhaeicola marinus TaxID=1912246 RepID=A0A5D0HTN7_9FLAO|nr:hypothetical protein [Seonamhaeicola marinus]TYA74361.1 hypothetical protein FUA24_13635 [Seonamhaeicola marinus]
MKVYFVYFVLLISLISQSQNNSSFVYFEEIVPYIESHKKGKEEIAKLVVKCEDSLKHLTNEIKHLSKKIMVKTSANSNQEDVDFINLKIKKAEEFHFKSLNRIKLLEKRLDSLTLIEITKIHKDFLKENNLVNVGISLDENSNQDCINYSNLFIKYLESK